jgi:hypothetical protein
LPYRPTGRPNGRPRGYYSDPVSVLEDKAAKLIAQAERHQAVADAKIAAMLAAGQNAKQVAAEIGRTPKHVRAAVRRARKRTGAQGNARQSVYVAD